MQQLQLKKVYKVDLPSSSLAFLFTGVLIGDSTCKLSYVLEASEAKSQQHCDTFVYALSISQLCMKQLLSNLCIWQFFFTAIL